MKQVIITADDFGLSEVVNEAVEQAHRNGILSTASLMIAGPAAADAVRRARTMPNLRVGLHAVTIEGRAALPRACPSLVDSRGSFPNDPARLALQYTASPRARQQLRAELAGQFRAFKATGLPLDHANAHKHMHLHPYVGRVLIETGLEYGLRALRVPAEPPATLAACGTPAGRGARALYAWTGLLRHQAVRAGLRTNDHCFGLAWSGHMTEDRLLTLAAHLPPGLSEIYFHPATTQDARLAELMPDYEHAAELAALISPAVREALANNGVTPATYSGSSGF